MSEKLISGILIIISFLGGLYADKFLNKMDVGTPGQPVSAKTIGPKVQDALSHNNQKPAVAFSITRNGSIQAFVPKGANVIKPKFPLHADNILNINTITIYSTSNPKTCWKNSLGRDECVTW